MHDGDLGALAQIIFQRVEAHLVDQLREAAAVVARPPHGDQLFGDVAVEVAQQGAPEEGLQAGALVDGVARRDDQAAAVDQVRGEGDVRGRKPEHGADQHRHLLVGQPLGRLLKIEQHGLVEVDVALLLVVARQFLEDQFVEGGAVVDGLHSSLHQPVQVADRGVQVDRWVEQQHALEAETLPGFVELADERGVQRAEAVAGQVKLGDGQFVLLRAHGLHHAIEVLRIIGAVAGCREAGGGGDEVETGRRGQLHHVIAGTVEEPLE